MREFDKGEKPDRNREYRKSEYLVRKAKIHKDINLKDLAKKARTLPYLDYSDPDYKRLRYVRYADDWIIGVRGSLKDTVNLKNKMATYCESIGLTLSDSKTKITNLLKNKAKFLGVYISRNAGNHETIRGATNNTRQRTNKQLRFTVSINEIRKKLKNNRFIIPSTKGYKPHPKFD